MVKTSPSLTSIRFHPLTASRWDDLEALFGERGACGGCWCMAWRLRSVDWVAGKKGTNRRAFQNIVKAGSCPGVLGYLGKQAVAWCAVAPREEYGFLARSRVLKPVDDQAVWSISCLFVLRPYRRRRLSAPLIRAAVDFAGRRGARVVEAYPVEPSMEKTPDPFIWTGVPSAFRQAGFQEVARRTPLRPVMRCTIS